jgi:hypothetical protein
VIGTRPEFGGRNLKHGRDVTEGVPQGGVPLLGEGVSGDACLGYDAVGAGGAPHPALRRT